MLDTPYGNGPAQIERGEEDVPVEVMRQVRKNFTTANRLLIPYQQVTSYFNERFAAQDIFYSPGISAAVDTYKPEYARYKDHRAEDVSFKTEEVDRTVDNRALFTEDEIWAGIELSREEPAITIALLSYQGTVQDYLHNLGKAFETLSQQPDYQITQKDLQDYQNYQTAWNSSNFNSEVMPALAIYIAQAKAVNPEATTKSLVTQELFQDAVDFVIANGGFRNFVTVPSHVALDGKERVNNFSCPAIGAIRQQLLDGSLLHRFYSVTADKLQTADPAAWNVADAVSDKAAYALSEREQDQLRALQIAEEESRPTIEIDSQDKRPSELAGQAISAALQKDKPAVFSIEDKLYTLTPDAIMSALDFKQDKQPDDDEIEPILGEERSAVLNKAVQQALETNRPVFFEFSGTPWRIDPNKVKTLLSQ